MVLPGRGCVILMWLVALSNIIWCFNVAAQYFEEIPLEKQKELINHIEFLDPTQLPSWPLGTSDVAQTFRYIQFPGQGTLVSGLSFAFCGS